MVWLKRDAIQRAVTPAAAAVPLLPQLDQPADPLQRLRRLLEQGQFPPGSRLPPERALAVQLQVGRPALREAIKALCAMDVLESRRGSGTYLKARGPLAPRLSLPAGIEQPEMGILDLLEARKILEPRAAWLAATRAGERQLREIDSARLKLLQHAGYWRLVARLDYELHATIIRGAQNPALDLLGRMLAAQILENRSLAGRFTPDVERMCREHDAVVDAVLKRQPEAAERAMMEHLNSVGLDFVAEVEP